MARQTFSLHLLEESILHFLGLLNGIATLHECRVLAGSGGAGKRLVLLVLLLLFCQLFFWVCISGVGCLFARAGLPFIPAERQSHYVREFLFVCRVLLERQRLAMQEARSGVRVIPGGAPGASVASSGPPQGDTNAFVALETELRVPILQLRDSMGLFRDRSAAKR